VTSAAKAAGLKKALIGALKRCATQKQVDGATHVSKKRETWGARPPSRL